MANLLMSMIFFVFHYSLSLSSNSTFLFHVHLRFFSFGLFVTFIINSFFTLLLLLPPFSFRILIVSVFFTLFFFAWLMCRCCCCSLLLLFFVRSFVHSFNPLFLCAYSQYSKIKTVSFVYLFIQIQCILLRKKKTIYH